MQLELVRHDKCLHLTPQAERIFRHGFYICNHELGIVNRPGIVQVDFRPLEKGVGGCTDGLKTGPYGVSITVESPQDMLHTLTHEMVHVDQISRGDLRIDLKRRALLWKNRPIFVDVEARRRGQQNPKECDEPHEEEAYRVGPELYRKTLAALPREDLQFLLQNSKSCGGKPEAVFSNWDVIKRLADAKRKLDRLDGGKRFKTPFGEGIIVGGDGKDFRDFLEQVFGRQ